MTEKQRLEAKIARLERTLEDKTMTPSEKQAAKLGFRPATLESDDAADASAQQAARLLGEGDR